MKRFCRFSVSVSKITIATLILGTLVIVASNVRAQPLADSLHALEQRNEKMYRMLNSMDDKGSSYEFTNVTAWHITDQDLFDLVKKVYEDQYGQKQLKDFEIDDIYIFSAPAGNETFEPFHILFMGKRVKSDTNGVADVDPFFGGGKHRNTNEKIPIAFKGQSVVRMMRRQPALLDQINAVQGEIVELPGDILPSGVQLIKSSTERYIFHKMFDGFYSKRQIIDEQNRALGLPTADESFAVASDTSANAGPNPDQIPVDPEATPALPDEQLQAREFKYGKTIDIADDHVLVNVSQNTDLEVQLGLPEVGLPFWSAGLGRFWLELKNQIGEESNFKLGLIFPLDFGNSDAAIFNHRNLSGGFGGSVSGYFAGIDFFSAFNMPVAFNFSILPSGSSNSSIIYNGGAFTTKSADGSDYNVAAGRTFYRTALVGQLYIPIIVQLDPANFFQFSAGVGVDNVYESWIPNASDTKASRSIFFHPIDAAQQDKVQDLARVSTPVTPHIGLEYVNHRSSKFGLNLYYDHLFTIGGWIELIEDHLRIETSYTAPLVRDPKPYEPAYFFQLTPRIYF